MRPSGAMCAAVFSMLILLAAPQPGWTQECVSGTITAEISPDPQFENMYKYCLELSWNLGNNELGHLDIFLQLENCECICDPRFIQFGDPAGETVSRIDGGTCVNEYYGEYICVGDPSLPQLMLGPAIKFEPLESTCEPGLVGTGLLCFYSPMPPATPGLLVNGLAIKHGQQVCNGHLTGVIPSCDCFLQNGAGTWGELKVRYR